MRENLVFHLFLRCLCPVSVLVISYGAAIKYKKQLKSKVKKKRSRKRKTRLLV